MDAYHTQIVSHEPDNAGVMLHSEMGARIRAHKVVFATGYEAAPLLGMDLVRLASTYALITEPVSSFRSWPGRSMIWESARPYLYLRTTSDNRVIVGGEDVSFTEPKARDALISAKADAMVAKFSVLFPEIAIKTAHQWAGTFAESKDGLPYIGGLPSFPHSYFALGYGGNGITFSLLAAQIIRDVFLGRESKLAHVFRFGR